MIIIGLDGITLECPDATGWTLTDGRIHVVSGADVEHGVFAKWDYVIDSADFTGAPADDAGGAQGVPPCATCGPPRGCGWHPTA